MSTHRRITITSFSLMLAAIALVCWVSAWNHRCECDRCIGRWSPFEKHARRREERGTEQHQQFGYASISQMLDMLLPAPIRSIAAVRRGLGLALGIGVRVGRVAPGLVERIGACGEWWPLQT